MPPLFEFWAAALDGRVTARSAFPCRCRLGQTGVASRACVYIMCVPRSETTDADLDEPRFMAEYAGSGDGEDACRPGVAATTFFHAAGAYFFNEVFFKIGHGILNLQCSR